MFIHYYITLILYINCRKFCVFLYKLPSRQYLSTHKGVKHLICRLCIIYGNPSSTPYFPCSLLCLATHHSSFLPILYIAEYLPCFSFLIFSLLHQSGSESFSKTTSDSMDTPNVFKCASRSSSVNA